MLNILSYHHYTIKNTVFNQNLMLHLLIVMYSCAHQGICLPWSNTAFVICSVACKSNVNAVK